MMNLSGKVVIASFIFIVINNLHPAFADSSNTWWNIQSIDTMKQSRDLAREKVKDTGYLDNIDLQIKNIAETGANYVAIATPYDEEFFPFLKSWVDAARKYNLKVWFRGNWSGWEGWFGYPHITREEHLRKSQEFIKRHISIFQNGDIFSACPECENGGPGDPRSNNDVEGHRAFLIAESVELGKTFREMGLNVKTNFSSMNADVALVVMDKETTKKMGGLVVIDHYVSNPKQIDADVRKIADNSGGKVFLGEFGAPIPDLNGDLDAQGQATWINEALNTLYSNKNLEGLNYWVNKGGSTEIWDAKDNPKPAVAVLKKYFLPIVYHAKIVNTKKEPIANAKVISGAFQTETDENGEFKVKQLIEKQNIFILAQGYKTKILTSTAQLNGDFIILDEEKHSWFVNFINFLKSILFVDFRTLL